MFDQFTNRVLALFGASFILLNCLFGYLHCRDNFCPGDRESDWVYEYKDEDGNRYVVVDGKAVPKESYTGGGK